MVMDFLNEYPQIYISTKLLYLSRDQFDLEISRSIINRTLKYIRITYRYVKPVHDIQNDDLRVK
jgi:hypothetical protein